MKIVDSVLESDTLEKTELLVEEDSISVLTKVVVVGDPVVVGEEAVSVTKISSSCVGIFVVVVSGRTG